MSRKNGETLVSAVDDHTGPLPLLEGTLNDLLTITTYLMRPMEHIIDSEQGRKYSFTLQVTLPNWPLDSLVGRMQENILYTF